MYQKDEPDYKRLALAIFLAAMLLIGWQAFVEWPRRQALLQYQQQELKKRAAQQAAHTKQFTAGEVKKDDEDNPALTHEQRIGLSPRVTVDSPKLHGSIALKGARFDDIKLAHYRDSLEMNSPEVTLFSPAGDAHAYFAQIGWVANDGKTKVPDQRTVWTSDNGVLSPGKVVTLRWDNGEGVTFRLKVSLDEHYMFTVAQQVENHSGHDVSVSPYAYINRVHQDPQTKVAALHHEGPLGVVGGELTEMTYDQMREKRTFTENNSGSGWLGITDKYWLTALVPGDADTKVTFSYYERNGLHRYQADYLGQKQDLNDGATGDAQVRLFAGAKEVSILDGYATGDAQHPPIPLFDRAVDFGSMYFLTKPMFKMLTFFYTQIGNFGIAIMLLTIVIRLALYPLANKSYKAAAQMRRLQPEMAKIRERYFDDQIAMNKEMMALYKREKVNPASGCLPVLIQMPVFFALYRVLSVTIEMRQAPFFGWIRDLSAPDPSNLFTGFGLVPWNHPVWMHLGVLPILYCLTMIIQMKQQPQPTDPVQAKVMGFMPYFLLFIFAGMPAGLVVYWVWSNIISIVQQHFIGNRYLPKEAVKA